VIRTDESAKLSEQAIGADDNVSARARPQVIVLSNPRSGPDFDLSEPIDLVATREDRSLTQRRASSQ
jgi:hypothetical protein